jgi:hypothetical protein
VREKYCWLVADKPSEQADMKLYACYKTNFGNYLFRRCNASHRIGNWKIDVVLFTSTTASLAAMASKSARNSSRAFSFQLLLDLVNQLKSFQRTDVSGAPAPPRSWSLLD